MVTTVLSLAFGTYIVASDHTPKTTCKVIQDINLNVLNSILKPSDQIPAALFNPLLPIYVGIPTNPCKRHATGLLLYWHIPYATTQKVLTIIDSAPTASYYIPEQPTHTTQ